MGSAGTTEGRWRAWIREWLRIRIFPTEPPSLREARLRAVAVGTLAVAGAGLVSLMAVEPSTIPRRLVSLAVVTAVIGTVLQINRRGHTTAASWLFVLGLIAVVTQRAWITGGIYAPVMPLYVLFVLMGGVLLARVGGVVSAIASTGGAVALILGQRMGLVTPVREFAPPMGMVLFLVMILGIALVLQFMIGSAFRASLARAEAEVAQRNAVQTRLDLALSAARIAVWEMDPATNRLLADSRMGELYDLDTPPDQSFALDDILAKIHPGDAPRIAARRARVQPGAGTVAHDHRIIRPDGSIRYVRGASVATAHPDGSADRVVGVTMDVTDETLVALDRTRAVHDLGERVKELRLLHATAIASQRVWPSTRDLLAHVVDRMPAAWQYPECTEARITLGDREVTTTGWRRTAWVQSVPFVTGEQRGVIEVAYTEPRPPEAEGPFLKEERDLLVSLSEMLAAVLDGQRTRRELEQLVQTRTQELRTARDAAEQAAKAKGAFLANMSHEIRTPMNAILGYEQLLQGDANLTDDQRRKLDVIRSSGDHLLDLINDILDMSRIEAGHAALSEQPFDLHAKLRTIEAMFAVQTSRRSLSLDVHVDATVPRTLRADPGKVRQVLINLIGNAVKFTDVGGVRVHASASPEGDHRCRIAVRVSDTGPGIDASEWDVIFSPFGQAARGSARGGTGLGLAISRSFARMMDGDITVSSAKGQGSVFTFTFAATVVPGAAIDEFRSAGTARRLTPHDLRRKVLVVDDVRTNREVMSETLTRAGFETRAAASGEDALAQHDLWRPDVIVSDLHMPGIGGLEALRLLRARGAMTPVIITTAATDADAADAAQQAGAQRVLRKPHRQSELLDAVAAALGIEMMESDLAPRVVGPDKPRVPLRQLVRSLASGVVAQLAEAARSARAARLIALAAEIEADAPDVAATIRYHTDRFEYRELLDALTTESTNDR